MFIDKQGKLFGKVSIIDIGIILVVLAAISILGIKFLGSGSQGKNAAPCEYVVKVADIKQVSAESITENKQLFNEDGAYMGTIKSVEVKPSEKAEKLVTGEYALVHNPERVDVYVTIEGNGVKNSAGYYLDGKVSLLVGTERFFEGPDIDFTGTVVRIIKN